VECSRLVPRKIFIMHFTNQNNTMLLRVTQEEYQLIEAHRRQVTPVISYEGGTIPLPPKSSQMAVDYEEQEILDLIRKKMYFVWLRAQARMGG